MNTLTTRNIDVTDLLDRSETFSIGVLSDTHGVVSENVSSRLTGCHIILHAGDVCGQNVLDELGRISRHVYAVGGNNDKGFSYTANTLPDVVNVKIAGATISLLHGHQFGIRRPDHDAMRDAFSDSKTIIYGHTHQQVHETSARPWVLNPGAAGETRTKGGASCALISVTDGVWNVSLHKN